MTVLAGYRTYIGAAVMVGLVVLGYYGGFVTREEIAPLFGIALAGTIASLRLAVAKVEKDLKSR